MIQHRAAVASILFASLLTTQVVLADGVLEINQACVAAGCFSGDAPGFPVEIEEPGSYVLTSNLDVRDEPEPENVSAIYVATDGGVTINLNGFRIIGPTKCTTTECSPTGTGRGISGLTGITDQSQDISIRNGTIYGLGLDGVRIDKKAWVEKLRVEHCGGDGIAVSSFSQVRDSIVFRNGGDGVEANGIASQILGNVIRNNLGWGLRGSFETSFGLNTFSNNTLGAVDEGVQIASNLCGNSLCADPVP